MVNVLIGYCIGSFIQTGLFIILMIKLLDKKDEA